VKSKRTPIVY